MQMNVWLFISAMYSVLQHPSEYFGASGAREEVQPAGGGISAKEAAQSLQAALSDVDPNCLSHLVMSSGLAMQVRLPRK